MFDPARHGHVLLDLLALETVTPMEQPDGSSEIEAAFDLLECSAHALGPIRVERLAGSLDGMNPALVPVPVQTRMVAQSAEFFTRQPNMAIRLGAEKPAQQLLFNVHIDTVGPHLPVEFRDGVYHGRGVADAKGPGMAMLAGLEAAIAERPDLLDQIGLVLQFVTGEEGGAMGVYGTRHLFERGYTGDLNLFLEPTGGRYIDFSTVSMTAELRVEGIGCTDDQPGQGENATLILSVLANHIAQRFSPLAVDGVKFCLAGIKTGEAHNRVYADGTLKMNIAYRDAETGQKLEEELERCVAEGLDHLEHTFSGTPAFDRTARAARAITELRWLKRRLPTLSNRSAPLEACLLAAGFSRLDEAQGDEAFTCDAIWGGLSDGYSAIVGPGDLAANGAHTAHEQMSLADLDRFAKQIASLTLNFADAAVGVGR
jgi:acetylornithine deacetylase/succinyl-diaminopimelate desuccinylase-like protein